MIRKFSFAKSAKKQLAGQGAQDAYVIEFAAHTAKSVDEIWGALVKPEKITAWLMPVSGKLAKGGAFRLGDLAEGSISVCEPKRRLSIDLVRGTSRQMIDITFGEEGKGKSKHRNIVVKITANLADLPEGNWQKLGPAALGMGWELVAQALQDYLAGEQAAPRQGDIMAFASSAEGRAFCSEAFSGWRAAAIAGGADAGIMAGQAPSVLQIYSGLHA
jgi:uncharacterized protein YndB with AHSA1/START domain